AQPAPPRESVTRVTPFPAPPPPPPPAPAPPPPAETPAASPPAAPPPASALSVETDRSKSSGDGVALPEGRKSSVGDASASGTSGTSTTASVPRSDTGSSSSGTPGGSSRGITQWAHPQGGYQVHPTYPASARRLGIQGTARLRVQVLADGKVGEIIVESSAGHADLDKAAADAVRQWRVPPARQGNGAGPPGGLFPRPVQIQRPPGARWPGAPLPRSRGGGRPVGVAR